ncbi:hypothetical protein DEO72_LG6g1040 [Vigna unguiculata]|uniref:Uncharacterized protein n=1 Tax=Vigna unguiculata TaxID=3917 RepID=A0A4D6M724_VIGUN|nr:hypothetical protein DEO72_LG6g1040 [Vigna unguiculata]
MAVPPSSHRTTTTNLHLCTSGTQIHAAVATHHLYSGSSNTFIVFEPPSSIASTFHATASHQPFSIQIFDVHATHLRTRASRHQTKQTAATIDEDMRHYPLGPATMEKKTSPEKEERPTVIAHQRNQGKEEGGVKP